eukprot:806575-Rhodomonas_salina.1
MSLNLMQCGKDDSTEVEICIRIEDTAEVFEFGGESVSSPEPSIRDASRSFHFVAPDDDFTILNTVCREKNVTEWKDRQREPRGATMSKR